MTLLRTWASWAINGLALIVIAVLIVPLGLLFALAYVRMYLVPTPHPPTPRLYK